MINVVQAHSASGTRNTVTEHLYSPNQATRQTEDRLYTQGKEKHTKYYS